jgi:eukaryotic-like serine/threonine-protein kinase
VTSVLGRRDPDQGAEKGGRGGSAPPGGRWELREGDDLVPGRTAVKLLGGGERYETYLAWDDRLFSLVVVKVVRPGLVHDDHSLRGLAAEAALLERLRHPVLVRGFGANLHGPRPHVVLEHLDGPRLSTLVRKQGVLEPEQLLPLGLQLCSALHYLGEEGIVHLDVKPSNIIMGAPARLIDLSIARPAAELAGVTHRIGTDAYMAPEQCDPVAHGPMTFASDVWGVGATLYHALVGRPPFPRGDGRGRGRERFPQLVQRPDPLPADVSRPLAELVESCLAFDPSDRPGPAALAADLELLVDSLPRRPVLSRFRVRPRRSTVFGETF